MAEFDIMNKGGISRSGNILDVAIEQGVVEKSGAFLKYQGTVIAQGRDAAKEVLEENAKLLEQIEKEVMSKGKNTDEISIGVTSSDEDQIVEE